MWKPRAKRISFGRVLGIGLASKPSPIVRAAPAVSATATPDVTNSSESA